MELYLFDGTLARVRRHWNTQARRCQQGKDPGIRIASKPATHAQASVSEQLTDAPTQSTGAVVQVKERAVGHEE